jgi:hypothetical protein
MPSRRDGGICAGSGLKSMIRQEVPLSAHRRLPAVHALIAPAGMLFALVAGPAGAARQLVPDPAMPAMYQITGKAVDLTQGGIRTRIEPLTMTEVEEWFRTRTRAGKVALPLEHSVLPEDEPNGPRAGKGRPIDPFTIFAVSFENGSGGDVTFVPDMCSLIDQKGVELSPLPSDYLRAMVRQMYGGTPDPDVATDDAMKAIHAEAVVLHDGQRVSRLLIFPPSPKAHRLALTLRHILIGQRDVSPDFSFISVE